MSCPPRKATITAADSTLYHGQPVHIRTHTPSLHPSLTTNMRSATLLLPLSLAASSYAAVIDLEARQGPNILAGAPVSNVTVKADNLVQCAESTISWTGGQVRFISRAKCIHLTAITPVSLHSPNFHRRILHSHNSTRDP